MLQLSFCEHFYLTIFIMWPENSKIHREQTYNIDIHYFCRNISDITSQYYIDFRSTRKKRK